MVTLNPSLSRNTARRQVRVRRTSVVVDQTRATVERAIADIAAGRPVLIFDSTRDEGALAFAAQCATSALLAFLIRYGSGVVCVPIEGERLDQLALPPMCPQNSEPRQTQFTVSVDARVGITTGISAADRAHTIRTLVGSATTAYDLSRPGHVFPLRYRAGGVLRHPQYGEGIVDLARLARLTAAGVFCEVISSDGTLAHSAELHHFCAQHGLQLASIADVAGYRVRTEKQVHRATGARLPTKHGEFRAVGFTSYIDGCDHVALIHGEVHDRHDVLVHVHNECLTGDVLGSLSCECSAQLDAALRAVASQGRGVIIYMRGADSITHDDTRSTSGMRDVVTAAQMLLDLDVRGVQLLAPQPEVVQVFANYGLRVVEAREADRS